MERLHARGTGLQSIETKRRMTDRMITFAVVITKVAKRSHRAFFGA